MDVQGDVIETVFPLPSKVQLVRVNDLLEELDIVKLSAN